MSTKLIEWCVWLGLSLVLLVVIKDSVVKVLAAFNSNTQTIVNSSETGNTCKPRQQLIDNGYLLIYPRTCNIVIKVTNDR